jgi:hypothetical protein
MANEDSQRALDALTDGEYATATTIQVRAATELETCLASSGHSASIDGRLRLGELWMYAGQYASRKRTGASAGPDHKLAIESLLKAKTIFYQLRTLKNIDRYTFDQVLLDAHEADTSLKEAGYISPTSH